MTQRIVEAALAGCVPLVPDTIVGHETFTVPETVVSDAGDIADRVAWLTRVAGRAGHVDLIARTVRALDPFRLSRQLDTIERLLHQPTAGRTEDSDDKTRPERGGRQ